MLDCKEIDKELINKMFEMTKDSAEKYIEQYMLLCRKDGKIIPSDIIAGSKHHVSAKKQAGIECPKNAEIVADFHTHPTGISAKPTYDDIVSSASMRMPSFCVGRVALLETTAIRTLIDEVKCYDIKDKTLLKLGDDAQTLAEKEGIKKARDIIIPQMYDRIRELKIDNILETKCTLTRRRKS